MKRSNCRFVQIFILIFVMTISSTRWLYARTPLESLKEVQQSKDFVQINESPSLAMDLRYASTNNFVGLNLYGDFSKAFLHREAAAKLVLAEKSLALALPGHKLLIFDALRPRSVQKILWDKVKGTNMQAYVANPEKGSIHNYGFAVDISILDQKGVELDMGTPFDDFRSLAQPKLESEFLKNNKLTAKQVANRLQLRKIMTEAGFTQLPLEWWHFDALDKKAVREKYRIIE